MKCWNSLVSFINNMKIRKKLITMYVIAVLIPVLIVGIYFTNSMRNMVISRAIAEASTNTERTQDRLSEVLKKASEVSDRLALDSELQELVSKEYKDQWEAIDSYSGYTTFDEILRFYSEIESIQFYTNNKTMLDNSQFIKITDALTKSSWYTGAIDADGKIIWQYNYGSDEEDKSLCLARVIKADSSNNLGVLVINISNNYLNSIIKDEPFSTFGTIDEDKIIMTSSEGNEGRSLSRIVSALPGSQMLKDKQKLDYNGQKSIIIKTSFVPEKTGSRFGIVSIVPIDSITSKANRVSFLGFSIITAGLVISIILIFFFTEIFSRRVIMLRGEMNKVVHGDFHIYKNIEGKDEVGELYEDLNTMISSIEQLIHEVYEVKLQKEQLSNRQKEVEFKMLASQINPHFLYNTLETIRMKAHVSKQMEIAHIVKILAKLMRRNLEVSDHPVTLESELELVKNYLEIQKFRFGERINYEININSPIGNYQVLPLLLQPLVENAVIHGLENKGRDGHLLIDIVKKEGFLVIEISDNGMGIPGGELKRIYDKLNNFDSSATKSLGLSNVNQRIKLYYGEKYGLSIESTQDKGTKVQILLPVFQAIGEGISNVKSIID